MTKRTRSNTQMFTLGMFLGAIVFVLMSTMGCHMVEGLGRDVTNMAGATRNAMSKDE